MVGGIKIRWICNACFEIILPSGKTVVVDPFIDECETKSISSDQITGADYILLSHIHFDHILDVEKLSTKFNSKIFVGDLSATELCKLQHISVSQIYRVRGGETYQFDDCLIEVYSGRHTEWKMGVYYNSLEDSNKKRPKKELMSNWLGFMELVNYKITASDGTSVLIWGGMSSQDQIYRMKNLNPDIACVHLSPNQDYENYVRLLQNMNAKYIVPHHYDLFEWLLKTRPEIVEANGIEDLPVNRIKRVQNELEIKMPNSKFLEFERGKWYQIGTALIIME
ncbi:MBL fold metallo-hydrolase [Wukongibacter sp. M2B1]|uniref:MBL fold metallo-hydrolase n=1 Tax=Wukongibacter sp. M2B1 TaxID=3088895 RepID=UPI003D793009